MTATRTLLAPIVGIALLTAGAAHAAPIYEFSIASTGADTVTGEDRGGAVTAIDTTYDAGSQVFDWSYTVTDNNDGFWLVVSPGPNPKGTADELAILFGDLGDTSDPNDNRLTAYVYNGKNSFNSLTDPGVLLASFDDVLTNSDNGDGTQTVSFSIDATDINAAFAGTGTGVAYGEKLGIWFHPLAGSRFTYSPTPDDDGNFRITDFTKGAVGWYDTSNKTTTAKVPEPSVLHLAGIGLLAFGLSRLVAARRRFTGERSTSMALAV